jgi:hypothetical protein
VSGLNGSLTGSPLEAWQFFAPVLLDAINARAAAPPPLFVSLDEASAITGLARGYLKRLIAAGALPANHGGARGSVRVRRRDLDAIGATDAIAKARGAS